MPKPKKVNTETKSTEKKIAQKRKPKNAEIQIAEPEIPKQSLYSATVVLENGKTDIVIDWDKLREHIRTI